MALHVRRTHQERTLREDWPLVVTGGVLGWRKFPVSSEGVF
jgi:hypothetical protein